MHDFKLEIFFEAFLHIYVMPSLLKKPNWNHLK